MEMLSFDNWTARSGSDLIRACWLHDHRTVGLLDWRNQSAYCSLCRCLRPLQLAQGANESAPDVREHVLCGTCGLNGRVRAALGLLLSQAELHRDSHVYVTEQTTATYVWMQKHLPCPVTGSEFESDPQKLAKLTDYLHKIGGSGEVGFNDVTASRHADAIFDAVVSFDVLEHVPDYRKALAEFSRNLKQGGSLIATFPFIDVQDTFVRARLDQSGNVEHLSEPEYHGDPISGGVLCWYHFGWDILDACMRNGFRSARMMMPWNPAAGMHYGLWTLVAKK